MRIQGKTTRLSLIGRLRDKADQEAWYEFVEIYEPLVFNLVSRSGVQHSDASEITQQVLTKVLTSVESRDHENASGTFRGWLYRMASNTTIDFIRKNQRHSRSLEAADLEQIADPNQREMREFHLEYERQLFDWACEKVKRTVAEINWQAFWATTVIGETIPEAAKRLGISSGTIHVARSRIMSRITSMIQERLAESTDGCEGESLNAP
ncbi:MAG: sigma-70 family RNA polymerase sigma factor [Planctomycetota bacterium]